MMVTEDRRAEPPRRRSHLESFSAEKCRVARAAGAQHKQLTRCSLVTGTPQLTLPMRAVQSLQFGYNSPTRLSMPGGRNESAT